MGDEVITGKLTERFGGAILDTNDSSDMLTITVSSDNYHDLIRFLKEDEKLHFHFLTTLCGIHYPDQELPLGIVCHLHNFIRNQRIRVKTFLPLADPRIPTITDLFPGANWMERETYDFYGILFDGHPDLKRILNMEDLEYFPMRKEYPLEDQAREDKDDRYFGR
jgi:NADH-quinone oxidoreductase subunit C